MKRLILPIACGICTVTSDAQTDKQPHPNVIFIYADDAFREKRSKEAYEGISLKEMDKEDVSRQRYYNYYTGRTWGDPLNYDLMINTAAIGIDGAVETIKNYLKTRGFQI